MDYYDIEWFALEMNRGHSVVFEIASKYCISDSFVDHDGPYDYTVKVRNRFKGLDLIDRVPDELWTEVRDIVQETGIKTIPMEKKCKKVKWLSEEALRIAVKRREAKRKGEKERKKVSEFRVPKNSKKR